jgi:hypothetical protein
MTKCPQWAGVGEQTREGRRRRSFVLPRGKRWNIVYQLLSPQLEVSPWNQKVNLKPAEVIFRRGMR